MIEDDEKPEAPDSVPDAKLRFTPLVIVSMLFGFLLCLGSVGAYFGYQKNRGLAVEITKAREEIKKKEVALEDMKAQVEALSRQMSALKEFSVARSRGDAAGKAAPDASFPAAAPAVPPPENAKAAGKENAGSALRSDATLVPAKEKRAKPDAQNCELVGKSPEEQAATLKRCVSVMDDVTEKPRPGSTAEKKR